MHNIRKKMELAGRRWLEGAKCLDIAFKKALDKNLTSEEETLFTNYIEKYISPNVNNYDNIMIDPLISAVVFLIDIDSYIADIIGMYYDETFQSLGSIELELLPILNSLFFVINNSASNVSETGNKSNINFSGVTENINECSLTVNGISWKIQKGSSFASGDLYIPSSVFVDGNGFNISFINNISTAYLYKNFSKTNLNSYIFSIYRNYTPYNFTNFSSGSNKADFFFKEIVQEGDPPVNKTKYYLNASINSSNLSGINLYLYSVALFKSYASGNNTAYNLMKNFYKVFSTNANVTKDRMFTQC